MPCQALQTRPLAYGMQHSVRLYTITHLIAGTAIVFSCGHGVVITERKPPGFFFLPALPTGEPLHFRVKGPGAAEVAFKPS